MKDDARVCIVHDSGADLPFNVGTLANIVREVPLHFRSGDRDYTDGELSEEDFSSLLKTEFPATSGPTPGDYESTFIEAIESGCDHILCLPISSGISNSYRSAMVARDLLNSDARYRDKARIEVVDTHTITLPVGFLIERLLKIIEDPETTFSDLVEMSKGFYKNTALYVAIDSLKNLARGGRVSGVSAAFANILDYKVVVDIEDMPVPGQKELQGKIEVFRKIRTLKKALKLMIDQISELPNIKRVAVVYTDDKERAVSFVRDLVDALCDKGFNFSIEDIPVLKVALPIALHAGNGAVGVCAVF